MSKQVENVRLHEIAHARAGDKGNRSNISPVSYTHLTLPTNREV